MPLDPAAAGLIQALDEQGLKSFEHLGVEQSRQVIETFTGLQLAPQDVANVVDLDFEGPGRQQSVRIYIPAAAAPLPVVVYFHGGGFVGGSLNVADQPCRALANDLAAIVVAATYRTAPDAKFPAATNDTYAALEWVAANIADFGGDPQRLAVMGDSAGGNLAAVAAQRARDAQGPALKAQVLIYPVIDSSAAMPSSVEFADGYLITSAGLNWFWQQYLSSPADVQHPWATPSMADSFENLPPALVLTTEYEVARDEAEAYGQRLADAGVPTEIHRFDGLIHGVYWMSAAVPRSAELHQKIVDFLRRSLA